MRLTTQEEKMNLKIKKGKHGCNKILPIITFGKEISGTVQFINDASYSISEQKDTNKIIGLSDSYYHRRSSIRIGWRWNTKENKIEIMTIKYQKGIRTIDHLCFIDNNSCINSYKVKIYKEYYLVEFNDTKRLLKRDIRWIPIRYVCMPYFGGDEVAPKDFNIRIIIS